MTGEHAFDTTAAPGGSCPFVPVFAPPRIMIERGSGSELWDTQGRRYIDLVAGIAVVSLGHADPAVAATLAEQSARLLHVSNLFANPPASSAALDLVDVMRTATGRDGQVFFCNSGAEANEAAIKLARRHGGRGRHTVVTAYGSFHGRTLGALAATGQPTKQEPFAPMPEGFRHVAFGDLGAMESVLDASVAAVLLEPIQGEGGIVSPPAGYLGAVQAMCRERGILLMLDEVQTGFCRTGSWFAFEQDGLQPDVVLMAKGMGNGFPVGAMWASAEIAASFRPGDHGSTFSGGALAGAVVGTVIRRMRELSLGEKVARSGASFKDSLAGASGIAAIRGRGLLLGIELIDGVDARMVAERLLHRGVLVNALSGSILRIAPPLTISDALLAEASSHLIAALEEETHG